MLTAFVVNLLNYHNLFSCQKLYTRRIAHLDVNPNPISFLDDLLLIICLPSSFIYSILCIVPSVTGREPDPVNVIPQVCSVAILFFIAN